MLKLGSLKINKAYIGSTEINKMYLGGTIVFDNTIMHLSYNPTTSINLRLQTASGDDWEIDWGDGVWDRYASSTSYRTKTFSTPTSGVARVKSATGKGLDDFIRMQSTVGTWSFDATALSGLTSLNYLRMQGNDFTCDMTGVSAITSLDYLYLIGNGFTGDMGGVSGLTLLNTLNLQAPGFTWTPSTFTADVATLILILQTGELSDPADIDQMFIDLDAVATAKSGTFDLRSPGAAAPTAASSAARASLVSKGRTILTN